MKNPFIVGFSLVAMFCASCEKSEKKQEARITIDVYSDQKATGVKMNGDYSSDHLDIYIDDVFIGTTPVVFTDSDLERLELPTDERIDTSETTHWNTWDTKGDGTILISNPDRSVEKTLEYRSRDRANPELRRFKRLTKHRGEDGGIVFSGGFPVP